MSPTSLTQLAGANEGASAAKVPKPARRWFGRVALPVTIIAALVAVLLFAAREAILPATDVRVAPVIARPASGNVVLAQGTSGEASVLAQAPGWVEPEPYAIIVPSLVSGVVKDVFVLEGETIEAGQMAAKLIEDDAALEVERMQAELSMANAALERARAEEDVAAARLAEVEDEVARKRPLVAIGGVSEGEFARLELRQKALAAEQGVAKAAAANAAASAHRADVLRREAELALSRTTIRSPVAGVVLTRSVTPGSLVSASMTGFDRDKPTGIISVYDPKRLQVRAEVPLADFGKIGVGTRAEVTTEALPGVTIHGSVIRIVHEADIQRNTVQVKVLLENPPSVLKPDMLTRVRFVSGGESASAGANADSIATGGSLELLAPNEAIVKRDGSTGEVWVASMSRAGSAAFAELRSVELGREIDAEFVQVLAGLNPGDRLIIGPHQGLSPGARVRILGESLLASTNGAP